jgi:acid phosphatase
VPAASNQPFSVFPGDFTTLPTLSFVIPNQCDDMHDCSVATGDAWLQANIDAYAQWSKTHNSLLILTWDENDNSIPNQITTIFAGALVMPGQYGETINHFTVLATLEAMYGLDALGGAVGQTPITDVWDTTVFKDGFEPRS